MNVVGPFASLPAELLQLTVQKMGTLSVLSKLRNQIFLQLVQVCRHWRTSLLPLYWTVVDLTCFKPRNILKWLNCYSSFEFARNIKDLSISAIPSMPFAFNDLMNSLNVLNITKLELYRVNVSNFAGIRFPALRELRLEGMDCSWIASSTTKDFMKKLELFGCALDDSGLMNLLNHQQGLVVLAVTDCPITNTSLHTILKLNCLVELDISGTNLDIQGISFLGKLRPQIKRLGISHMKFTLRESESLAECLMLFSELSALDIRQTRGAIEALTQSFSLGLQELKFGSQAFVQDYPFRLIMNNYGNLTHLEFSNDTPVSDLALIQISQRLRLLQTLVLPDCFNLSPGLHLVESATLITIPVHLKYLTRFCARGYRFSATVLSSFSNHGKCLKSLAISHPVKTKPVITGDCIFELLKELKSLELLEVMGLGLSSKELKRFRKSYNSILIEA
jgi:hypothetical protein